ncbi:hypothetical protein [Blastococcus sp. URHD0036]|uniref:hypothetical protein n=1 Tax=Blastococcus sp. URHD0036 TaxID=1380356 RepID=UPI0004954DA6|nr:hypothetical protein [Blastococcus sp. URHD0036]
MVVVGISGAFAGSWLGPAGMACLVAAQITGMYNDARQTSKGNAGLAVETARPEVLAVAAEGNPIRAVKVLRDRTGLGLREATETVRRWLSEEGTPWR